MTTRAGNHWRYVAAISLVTLDPLPLCRSTGGAGLFISSLVPGLTFRAVRQSVWLAIVLAFCTRLIPPRAISLLPDMAIGRADRALITDHHVGSGYRRRLLMQTFDIAVIEQGARRPVTALQGLPGPAQSTALLPRVWREGQVVSASCHGVFTSPPSQRFVHLRGHEWQAFECLNWQIAPCSASSFVWLTSVG